MDKRTITQDIKNAFGGEVLLNTKEVAKCLGISRNTVPKLLSGLDYIQLGKYKKYLASDVAARLMEKRTMGDSL